MTMVEPDSRLVLLRAAHEADADTSGAAARARVAEVRLLHASGGLRSPAEHVHAARILVDSEVAADVELAQAILLALLSKEPTARPLAATAFDRLRLLAGKPQKFGTQFVMRDGHRQPWPVEPMTTDSERAKWGLPPLAELLLRGLGPR